MSDEELTCAHCTSPHDTICPKCKLPICDDCTVDDVCFECFG